MTHEVIVGHAGAARSGCFVSLLAERRAQPFDGVGAQRPLARGEVGYSAEGAINDRPGPDGGIVGQTELFEYMDAAVQCGGQNERIVVLVRAGDG